ncbi:MAG: HAD-IA family hydrolase [Bacteriovorax sp.]
MKPVINTLFLDIGGVLGTNGWDHTMRSLAAERFSLDAVEVNERHHLNFSAYEEGKLSLDTYLKRVIFYQERSFTPDEFKGYMYSQSRPFPEMINFFQRLKAAHHLKVAVVSNEGRELTVHRINKFGLKLFVDFFICSSFVHFRKPDTDIFQFSLDIAQVAPEQVAYIEDRAMFVEVAATLGINGIHHKNLQETKVALAELGVSLND